MKVGSLVRQDLLWYTYSGEELDKGKNDFGGVGDGSKWEGFRISCSIITDHQDVPMSHTTFLQRPHDVHSDASERSRDDRERLQGSSAPLGHNTGLLTDGACGAIWLYSSI